MSRNYKDRIVNLVDQIFQLVHRLEARIEDHCSNGLKFNRLKKFNRVYINRVYIKGKKNYKDDLIVLDDYIVSV